jgi:hypothetical protein
MNSETQFGVYYDGQASSKPTAQYMCLDEARRHKKAGTGTFINHGKDIRLHQKRAPECDRTKLRDNSPKVHDESCVMGPETMEANADGMLWAVVMTSAWKPAVCRI